MITEQRIEQNKQDFLTILRSLSETRFPKENVEKLISVIETRTDFFIAPASSIYHSNYKGGLCEHTLNVYRLLKDLNTMVQFHKSTNLPNEVVDAIKLKQAYPDDTIIIVGLLHDLCKVNTYNMVVKNKKDKNGQWVKYGGYEKNDPFPYGHGEKSVAIISKFLDLNQDEMLAIRWHLGMYEGGMYSGETKYTYHKAIADFPIVSMMVCADFLASQTLEAVYIPVE